MVYSVPNKDGELGRIKPRKSSSCLRAEELVFLDFLDFLDPLDFLEETSW